MTAPQQSSGWLLLRPTVSRSVCLGAKPHFGPKTRLLLLSYSCGFVDVGRPFLRQKWSVVYNCCWSSSEQSFSGISESRLPQPGRLGPRIQPPGTGWPSYTPPPRHWVPFSSPPTTRRVTVEVFDPASRVRVSQIHCYFATGSLQQISFSWRKTLEAHYSSFFCQVYVSHIYE
jgi:hypothetical protein